MCGQDLPVAAYASRFGALAVLNPTSTSQSPDAPSHTTTNVSGSIAFFNDYDNSCSIATHLRFVPSEGVNVQHCHDLFVDLHRFGIVRLPNPASETQHFLAPLRKPLHLHVGEDLDGNTGIVGYRVALCGFPSLAMNTTSATVMAEGIVGFNSLPRRVKVAE